VIPYYEAITLSAFFENGAGRVSIQIPVQRCSECRTLLAPYDYNEQALHTQSVHKPKE
jgi:hypothetical protein